MLSAGCLTVRAIAFSTLRQCCTAASKGGSCGTTSFCTRSCLPRTTSYVRGRPRSGRSTWARGGSTSGRAVRTRCHSKCFVRALRSRRLTLVSTSSRLASGTRFSKENTRWALPPPEAIRRLRLALSGTGPTLGKPQSHEGPYESKPTGSPHPQRVSADLPGAAARSPRRCRVKTGGPRLFPSLLNLLAARTIRPNITPLMTAPP
jgi:hypothetical protein